MWRRWLGGGGGGGYSSSSRAGRLSRTLWPQNSTSVRRLKKGVKILQWPPPPPPPPNARKGGSIFYISMKSLQKKGSKSTIQTNIGGSNSHERKNRGQSSTSLKMGVKILHAEKIGVKILQCLKKGGSIFYIRPQKVEVKILHRLKKGGQRAEPTRYPKYSEYPPWVVNVIFEHILRIHAWALLLKYCSEMNVSHRTPLLIRQNWFGNGLVPSGHTMMPYVARGQYIGPKGLRLWWEYYSKPDVMLNYLSGNRTKWQWPYFATGHQVRCILWVQGATYNKRIGFLCGLKLFAWNIFPMNTCKQVYVWFCNHVKKIKSKMCN